MEGDGWLESAPEAGATRVVSFNIRNGRALNLRHCWWRRRRAVLKSLLRLDPDLVGLQEAYGFQARWLCRKLKAYSCYGVGRTDGGRRGEQAMVLHRAERYRLLHVETRWYGDTPTTPGTLLPDAQFPRTAAIVRLEDRRDGTRLAVVNTHLDAKVRANRLRSATQLASWVEQLAVPTVVVGDLNEGLDGPAVVALAIATGLRHAVPAEAGGSNHDFTGRTDGRRLDHVLVPPSWTVRAAGVDHRPADGRLASDHWPVVADLVPGPG
jgi:endonuclease/exonuclease/phosphatase family metal-dependent hydrolase